MLMLTEEAVNNDKNCGVPLVPVAEIYSDNEFNTRHKSVSPIDVIDLARSISTVGLMQPIMVRKLPQFPEDKNIDPQYKYAVIAGFRRLMAYKTLQAESIPALVKECPNMLDYRTINVIENIQRQDLTLWEEALCVEDYVKAGLSKAQIAKLIGLSEQSIYVRMCILKLQPAVQEEIAQGNLKISHIPKLYQAVNNPQKQIELAVKIKESQQRGEKIDIKKLAGDKPSANSKKVRNASEMMELQEQYSEVFGYDITTKILAWCRGDVSNFDVQYALFKHAASLGKTYNMPKMEH